MNRGILGFVGQGMDGRKKQLEPSIIAFVDTTASSSLTVPENCYALIALWGAGKAGGVPAGGDGGDAVFSRIRVQAGWIISWAVGAGGVNPNGAGGDTTVSLPGATYRAKGGGSAAASQGPYVSPGGKGGAANVNGGAGADGGGAGGAATADAGGGGGSGGLRSKIADFQTGGAGDVGDTSVGGQAPGGGGGGNGLGGMGTNGAAGRVMIELIGAA